MSQKSISHSGEDEWWGTFFSSPDQIENRVAGQLTYDQYRGLKLNFSDVSGKEPFRDSKVIFGILGGPNRQRVTLDITLDGEQIEFLKTYGNNGIEKSIYVAWAIFGFWYTTEAKISAVHFHQSNLEQLIGNDPDGFENSNANRQISEQSHSYRDGLVSTNWRPLGKYATADDFVVFDEVENVIEKREALSLALAEFDHKIFLKTKSNLHLAYERSEGISPTDIEQFSNDVLSFISVITGLKSATELVRVTSDGKHGSFVSSQLAPASIKPISVLKNAHHLHPINGSTCDLAKLFAEWSTFTEISTAVSASIRFGGTIEMHLVFLLTALEAINKFDGGGDREKYESPVTKYLSVAARQKLKEIKDQFEPDNEMGKFLSNLRANFVHINENTIDMSISDMIETTDILIALVTNFVLSKTSLQSDLIESHQQHMLRHLVSHEEALK